MQYWPRKRAQRPYARIRTWPKSAELKPLGFAGYKVGMTHILYTDAAKNSITKGEDIFCPVTVIECPPIKIIGYQAYAEDAYGRKAKCGGIINATKELSRRIGTKKKEIKFDESKLADVCDIKLIAQTQPALTGIGKKKPEIFELGIGGNDIKSKIEYAKSIIGKDIRIGDVFTDGQTIDTFAITTGRGTQGPVKRFGVSIRQHKAEKTKRGPATLGPWHPHHGNYTVPHAGKMGYHQRMQLNKWIVKISNDIKSINPKGGWLSYGVVKNDYMLLKGSVDGPVKRIIKMTKPRRMVKNIQESPPEIQYISLRSKQ
jgi:large subunit ribosomal protein L3